MYSSVWLVKKKSFYSQKEGHVKSNLLKTIQHYILSTYEYYEYINKKLDYLLDKVPKDKNKELKLKKEYLSYYL